MIGRKISKYKIIDKIGEGGMGVVYKAEDTELHRLVALKFLPPHVNADDSERARFLQEARAAAGLDHPNICTIHDIATVEGETFIAMTFVEGQELAQRIAQGPMPLTEVVTLAHEIAEALHEAHRKGVIHRDIKPSNVMINRKGHAILMDFGLAKLHGQTRITMEGTTLGTVSYMSPEQARGADVDHRSDIWSLGVMLYEMVAGVPPFRGDHQSAVLYAITNETARPLTSVRSDVPMELERIVNKAMAKDVSVRYQNVDDMAVDMKALLRQMRGDSDPKTAAVSTVTSSGPPLHGATAGSSTGMTPTGPRAASPLRWLIPVVGIAAIAVVAVLLLRGDKDRAPATTVAQSTPEPAPAEPAIDPNSLAVLPLGNLSGDQANEYFVDGMTEELITQLARIRSLKVISRTSVMRYKNADKPLTTIASELGVAKILEGSVMFAGDQVRITAQLIDGTNDAHLWANSYESDLSDVLGLQRQVAKAVAGEIKLELTPQEQAELATAPVIDPEAHNAYLRGRHLWHRRGTANIRASITQFEEAVRIDPNYAAAWVGLAEAWLVLSSWDAEAQPSETYPKVIECTNRALAIDPTIASAYAARAGTAWEYQRDWRGAEEQFRKAIELNPNYASAHQWYAEFLATQGRTDEAIRHIDMALERDPMSLIAHSVSIYLHAAAGDEAGMKRANEALSALEPEYIGRWSALSFAESFLGHTREALEARVTYEEGAASTEDAKDKAGRLRSALNRGVEPCLRELLRQALDARRDGYFSPWVIAGYYASLNDADSVVVWLEKGLDENDSYMSQTAMDTRFDPYRSDPRFRAITRDLDLEAAEDRFLKIRGRQSM